MEHTVQDDEIAKLHLLFNLLTVPATVDAATVVAAVVAGATVVGGADEIAKKTMVMLGAGDTKTILI